MWLLKFIGWMFLVIIFVLIGSVLILIAAGSFIDARVPVHLPSGPFVFIDARELIDA